MLHNCNPNYTKCAIFTQNSFLNCGENFKANYKKPIEQILNHCEPNIAEEIRHPTYIQTMGDPGIQSITRIIREVAQVSLIRTKF